MEKKELVAILQQHKEWLADNTKGNRADLQGADLYGADLSGADLRGANLRGADLQGAVGIYSFGPIGVDKRIGYAIKHADCVMVRLGCFWGTSDEAIEAVQKKYGENSTYEKQIRLAVEILEKQ